MVITMVYVIQFLPPFTLNSRETMVDVGDLEWYRYIMTYLDMFVTIQGGGKYSG